MNPFMECPIYENKNFRLRLVSREDATELLSCYGDTKSVPLFNSDNCNSDFYMQSEEEMLKMIDFWLMEYGQSGYIRFAIVNLETEKVIGTIEIFVKPQYHDFYGHIGLLRLDLASKYENEKDLSSLLNLIESEFKKLFKMDSLLTKAYSKGVERVNTLKKRGYILNEDEAITNYGDYYIKKWSV